jgi:hypothetical protein
VGSESASPKLPSSSWTICTTVVILGLTRVRLRQ